MENNSKPATQPQGKAPAGLTPANAQLLAKLAVNLGDLATPEAMQGLYEDLLEAQRYLGVK